MEIKFIKLNPTRNMTILVESPVPREGQGALARKLMAYEGLYAEQVGFIEPPENPAAWARLQMMGGEFCGNAAMSLAAVLAMDRSADEAEVPLEVSGLSDPISVLVNQEGWEARCTLEMPGPEKIEERVFPFGGADYPVTVVSMKGIVHLIMDAALGPADKTSFAERAIREWKSAFSAEAIGLILHDRAQNFIRPLIYVESTDTAIWERGCASGSAALGAALAHRAQGRAGADIAQPGGVISVLSDYASGRVSRTCISGQVKMVARGIAYL